MRRKFLIFGFLTLLIGTGTVCIRSQYVPPVLMYHSIDERAQETKLSVTPESFDLQLARLQDWNASVLSLEELVRGLKGEQDLPANARVLTFDDGFENFYSEAYPVLRKYGVPAAVFVVTEWVGRDGFLSWDQLRELAADPLVTVGSHSFSHAWLPSQDDEALRNELEESKRVMEEQLGVPVEFLCYPAGAFDARVREAAIAAGYKGAVATNPGPHYPDQDPYAIKRVRISRTSDNPAAFWLESSGYYTWIKEVRDEE
ncbi:MAG: polysaccharide deacetylase family protein [Candidatus Omnitrophica bacterium]|nr:polysaccharide deacetylase family protein [Candidatus Omnitrophota bacterium]